MSCHAPWLAVHDAAAAAFHDPLDRECSRCHGFHDTDLLHATGKTFSRPLGDVAVLRHCETCHRADYDLTAISAGHFVAAAQQYHVDALVLKRSAMSDICLTCHDETSGNPDVPAATPAFPAHASHPVGLSIPQQPRWSMSGFRYEVSPLIELYDDQIECVTCHRIPASTVFRLVPFRTVTDLCNGCHDMAPGSPAPVSPAGPAIATIRQDLRLVGMLK